MSFILDAIAKSEQERQQQEMPAARILALPSVSPQQPPRRILFYLVVGALLLNVAVLVVWMQSGQTILDWFSLKQVGNEDRQIEHTAVDEKATSTSEAVQPKSATTAISEDTVSVSANTSPEVVATIDNTASMNESFAERQSASRIGETPANFVNRPDTVQLEPVATVAGGDSAQWKRIEPDTLMNKAGSGQAAAPVQYMQHTGVLHRKISSLSELPSAVRNDLPTVVFSGHLYSSNPSSSVVFVDEGRPVMKGREIVDELFLYEITPAGVIVEFRGYLIDVGVLQNWTLN